MKSTDDIQNDFPEFFKPLYTHTDPKTFRFYFETEKGWNDIIYDACAKLKATGWDGFFTQIKQKFAELRMYNTGMTDEQYKILSEAEDRAEVTCEFCGEPGILRKDMGWLNIKCDACKKEHDDYREKKIQEYKEKQK